MDSAIDISSYAVGDDPTELSSAERIIEFYEEASLDYEHWSRGFNMHLGFYRRGLNPFNREAMLEQLNLEVADRLHIAPDRHASLVDLGSGMGAIARTIAKNYSNACIKGITLVPSQLRIATQLNAQARVGSRLEILLGDYTKLPFEDRSLDGAWAVESACYAGGPDKRDLVRDVARILRSGGRLVVADCFIKDETKPLNPFVKRCYEALCRNWALRQMPSLELFVEALERHGFRDIVVEDISWRAAPSLAHAPFAVLTFVLKKLFSGSRLTPANIRNLNASLLALVLGLNRSKFSYCLISGRRS